MKIRQTTESRAFFTSDPHYGHKNIAAGESSWIDLPDDFWAFPDGEREVFCRRHGVRNFKSVVEMNKALIDRFNSTVGEDDHLFILGDVAFGNRDNIAEFLSALRCKNLYLVYGNHDERIRHNKNNEKSYFKFCAERAEVTVDDQHIVLDHYAGRVWNHSHRGAWQLYGHSHGSLSDDLTLLSMDIGVDTNDLYPYSLDQLMTIMAKKTPRPVDHHR
jgi:calcineurin-like phosphoesterase family protein